MNVRLIHQSELSALLDLYGHLHAKDEPLPDPAVIQSVWDEINTNPRYRYFGIYHENSLISSCTLSVVPNLTRGCKPYGLIENVVTHASYRNQGHGKAILAHALSYAWSVGCYKVMLLTGRKDEATIQFYQSAGFDRNGKQAFVAKPPGDHPGCDGTSVSGH